MVVELWQLALRSFDQRHQLVEMGLQHGHFGVVLVGQQDVLRLKELLHHFLHELDPIGALQLRGTAFDSVNSKFTILEVVLLRIVKSNYQDELLQVKAFHLTFEVVVPVQQLGGLLEVFFRGDLPSSVKYLIVR